MSWYDDKEKAKKQKKSLVLKNNLFMLKKIFRYSPLTVVFVAAYNIVNGILGSIDMLLIAALLNGLDDGKSFTYLACIIAVAAGAFLLLKGFERLYVLYVSPKLTNKLHYAMHKELLEKSLHADLAYFDDPEYYNDFVFAMNNADGRAMSVLNDLGEVLSQLIYSGSVFAVIFSVSPLVTFILLFASAFIWLTQIKTNKIYFKWNKESNVINRKQRYLNRLFFLSDFAKEIRISTAGDMFKDQMNECRDQNIFLQKEYSKKLVLLELVGSFMYSAAFYGSMIYLFLLMAQDQIGMGGFGAAVTSTWGLLGVFNFFAWKLPAFAMHSLYIEKYRTFTSLEPKIKSGPLPAEAFESVRLEHVTFSYKEDQKPILKDISFEINKGERIAFVGYNGAGKTTLIKLLLRLYDPVEGRILYNGHDLKEYDLESLRQRMGAVFQDYKIFAASIAENVMGGECGEADRGKVLEALEAVAFTEKLKTLEQGIDTPLTREFDDKGVNLSGGEAQKIAIARVFARPFDMIVLDEPSSALDPVAEYELNRSLLNHCGEKTVIFISHRLSTTRVADRIYMFDSGSILESGSHDELLLKGGKYAEMFEMQSKNYKTAAEEQS